MNAPAHNMLAQLNPAQYEACMTLDGAVLILAGAGTGKTRVLTTRLANLVISGKASLHEILAVTFTNKAASEMRSRIGQLLDTPPEQFAIGTFHALSARFLRSVGDFAGLTSSFTILDADDQLRLMRSILDDHGIEESKQQAKALLYLIDRWKNKAWLADDVPESEQMDRLSDHHDAREFYHLYQQRLREMNAVDFGDLLLHLVNLWKNNTEILERFHQRFRYILVDEYQDTNSVQYLWLRLLAQQSRNICCVGDDDQAIYSWRGAEITNILRFEKDYPEAKIVRLETNYRSTGHILQLASGLISHNEGRMGKILHSHEGMGEKVRLCQLFSGDEEARYVASEIDSLQQLKKMPLDEVAILVRTGAQTRAFEEALLFAGLPYQIIGGLRFYEREEIRDIVAYLRLIAQPQDDLALLRIINKPTRGLGASSIQIIRKEAAQAGISMFAWLETHCQTSTALTSRAKASCKLFTDMIQTLQQLHRDQADLPSLTERVIVDSGYRAYVEKMSDKIRREGKLENLHELLAAQAAMQNLESFLEHISLVMDDARDREKSVSVMTIHAAKGLEFEAVFLPGWEDGLFPSRRTIEETGLEGLEEERRLAYVALTRAKRYAFVLYAAGRRIYGQWQMAVPSRFIKELPEESLEIMNMHHSI